MSNSPIKCLLILSSILHCQGGFSQEEMTKIYRGLFKDYDKRAIPTIHGKPIEIEFRIVIMDMVPRKERNMHFTMEMILEMHWIDHRLKFNTSGDYSYLPFDWKIVDQLWIPNIYFSAAKFGFSNSIPIPNALVFIKPSGFIILNKRINVESYCEMQLQNYPFDIQHCNFTIESYSFNDDYMKLVWKELSWKSLNMLDFDEIRVERSEDPSYQYWPESENTWSRLYIHFEFRRNIKLYLLRDFLPCFIIVSISWLNFWVNHRSTPARVTLCITTVLTIVTMTNQVRQSSPSADLFRSIDYYMLFCNLFVFAALGETTIVGMTAPNSKPLDAAQQMMDILQNDDDDDDNGGKKEEEMDGSGDKKVNKKVKRGTNRPENEFPLLKTIKFGPLHFYKGETHNTDKVCRVAFPITFLLFNAIFFASHYFKQNTIFSR